MKLPQSADESSAVLRIGQRADNSFESYQVAMRLATADTEQLDYRMSCWRVMDDRCGDFSAIGREADAKDVRVAFKRLTKVSGMSTILIMQLRDAKSQFFRGTRILAATSGEQASI